MCVNDILQRLNKKSFKNLKLFIMSGGPKGIRTPDLLNANQALSQLSYRPMSANFPEHF